MQFLYVVVKVSSALSNSPLNELLISSRPSSSTTMLPASKSSINPALLTDEELLKTISSDAHGSMLIMDLLEEAQDILVLENGKMITATEALEDYLAINELNISRRISIEEIDSEIWERLCDKLIDTIRHTYRFENTCVVRNYLSLRHGNSESVKFFQNIDVLNRKNLVLKNRYDYLISHMPGCKEVNYSSEDIYTPDDYVYGCKPNYYSPDAYRKVAHEIYRVIGEKEWK